MSVIGNALKAAQREKQRRSEAGGAPPLIVPLRGRESESGFSWRRALLLGVGGAVIFGLTAVAVNLTKKDSRSTPAPPPTILGDVPTATAPGPVVAASEPPVTTAPLSIAPPSAPTRSPTTTTQVPGTATPSAPAAATPAQQGGGDAPNAGLRIAVEPPREDASRLFTAAVAAHRSGDLTYARTAYERVLTMVPNDVDAMNNLGILLSAQRDYDRAERMLRRASGLAPRNAGVWNNLGTVLRERGQSADAIAAFQQALTIDPLHQSARIGLAQQYFALGSLAKARELLEQVVAGNPAVPEAQYTLGQVLEQMGDRQGAIRAYTAFVQSAPGRFAAHVESVRQHLLDLERRTP